MIRYINYNNIDLKKWDSCIQNSINTNFYAMSWYLDIICENWDALILNDYEAVMPLPIKNKFGFKYIYQPFFCQQLGLFYKKKSIDVDQFINSIPKSFFHFKFNLNSHNKSSYSIKKNTNYILYLDKEIEKLRDNYSKSHLKNIKRANKSNLCIASKPDCVENFCINKQHLAYDYMTKKQFDLEYRIIKTSLALGKGEIFSVKGKKANCCSVFIINDNNKLYLLSSYSNKYGKLNSAYFYLLDYIFSLDKFKGFVFDFEGSNLKGVAQRNKGFGAIPNYYYTVSQNIFQRCLSFISTKNS